MKRTRAQVDLADQLRSAFAKSGLSRYMLAKRAELDYGSVHRFIGGERELSLASASKLCEALGLKLVSAPTKRKTVRGGKRKGR